MTFDFDSAATTKMSSELEGIMRVHMARRHNNPNSAHPLGNSSRDHLELARREVRNFLTSSCDDTVVFTSSGSEANNLAILGLREMLHTGTILYSAGEHPSVKGAVFELAKQYGHNLREIPYDKTGHINMERALQMIQETEDVVLVTIMHTNNITGTSLTRDEIQTLADTCKKDTIFHMDCVQAAFDKDIKDLPCDLVTISSHKIHGPLGAGALLIKGKELKQRMVPVIFGGSNQEYGLRGGTQNLPAIMGFAGACLLAEEDREKNTETIAFLSSVFYKTLRDKLEKFGYDGIFRLNGKYDLTQNICAKIISITTSVDAETLMYACGDFMAFSSGSACSSNVHHPNETLLAMGLTEEEAMNTIRVSFDPRMDLKDVSLCAERLAKVIYELSEKNK